MGCRGFRGIRCGSSVGGVRGPVGGVEVLGASKGCWASGDGMGCQED